MKILSNHLFKICLLCFFIFTIGQVLAQIPQQMNYQGAVRNNKGEPIVNQPITIRLSILDNGPNSASVYTEVRQLSTNAVGLYSVAIGKPEGIQNKTGDFTQINWGIGVKYLKVEVDLEAGNNFTTAGVSPLLSVPYSLYAKYAENGPIGPPGPAGLSAYEIWEGLPGNDGKSLTEFLAGLKGADGLSAYEIWEGLPGNDGKTIQEFLAGLVGPAGASGLSAYEIWQGLPGNDGKTLEEFLAGLVGPQGPPGPAGGGTGTLTNSHILVGDINNAPADVALSGDATINNTGALTIADNAVTLAKMGTAGDTDANKIYITNAVGDPQLVDKNLFSWNVNGNTGTNSTHFIGTTDVATLRFKVNNKPAGRLTNFDRVTALGVDAGINALEDGTTQYSLFLGYGAGRTLTNSEFSVFIGSRAGAALFNSVSNTIIGAQAANNASFAERNTYIGASSGINNNGADNLFLGYNSVAFGNTAISKSVFIGSETGTLSALPLVNSIAIGYKAQVDADNSMALGGIGENAVKVGIGTTVPTQKLHIKDGHIRSEQTIPPTTQFNVANGFTSVDLMPGATDVRGTFVIRGQSADFANYSIIQLNLNMPATNSPVVSITPANLAAAQSDYYVEQTSNGFLLYIKGKTAVITDPKYHYIIIE